MLRVNLASIVRGFRETLRACMRAIVLRNNFTKLKASKLKFHMIFEAAILLVPLEPLIFSEFFESKSSAILPEFKFYFNEKYIKGTGYKKHTLNLLTCRYELNKRARKKTRGTR